MTELKVDRGTIIRTIVLFVTIINTVLTVCGLNPIPFSEEEIYTYLTAAADIAVTLWCWWKNNSFTKPAIKADQYLAMLKKDGGDGNEV